MRSYAFPQLSREHDSLCRDLLIQDDSASHYNPNSPSNREIRRLLAANQREVIAILRQLLDAPDAR